MALHQPEMISSTTGSGRILKMLLILFIVLTVIFAAISALFIYATYKELRLARIRVELIYEMQQEHIALQIQWRIWKEELSLIRRTAGFDRVADMNTEIEELTKDGRLVSSDERNLRGVILSWKDKNSFLEQSLTDSFERIEEIGTQNTKLYDENVLLKRQLEKQKSP